MNDFVRRERPGTRGVARRLAWALALFLPLLPTPARAASLLSKNSLSGPYHSLTKEWDKFRAYFQQTHTKTAAEWGITHPNGSLNADSPIVKHLEWRRAQDPAAFDRRFPKLGNLLAGSANAPAPTGVAAQSLATTPVYSVSRGSAQAGYQTLIPPPAAADLGAPGKDSVATAGAVGGPSASPAVTPAAQAITVPEPSAVASTLALFAAAGVWWSRRGAGRGRRLAH